MDRKLCSGLAPVLTLFCISLAASSVNAQAASAPFAFRSGQAMYIVAFRRSQQQVVVDPLRGTVATSDTVCLELGAESKLRNRIEEWRFFRVSEKLSEADFIFLVSLDDSSMEGLAIPLDAYRRHFKEKFDLDALREAAYSRYLAGPLKLPTLGRLSDRLVKDFRVNVERGNGTSIKRHGN